MGQIKIPQGKKLIFTMDQFFDTAQLDEIPAGQRRQAYWSVGQSHATITGGACDSGGNYLAAGSPSLFCALEGFPVKSFNIVPK